MVNNPMPAWLNGLEKDDLLFIKHFILNSGSLKVTAQTYGVTYPTIRLRLDRLIQKIENSEREPANPILGLIQKLVISEKISVDVARQLMEAFEEHLQSRG
jgi:hypothetical protein